MGLQPTDEGIEITLACPDVAEGNDFGTVILGDRRHGHRIFVNI